MSKSKLDLDFFKKEVFMAPKTVAIIMDGNGRWAKKRGLPRTAEEIRREYQWLKNSIGKNGGWICAPTHHVQLDTPMENFFTLLETIGIEDKRKK